MHLLSAVFWSTGKRQTIGRFLGVSLSVSFCLFGSHTLYVLAITEIYGNSFAFFRPLITSEFHCIAAAFLFYVARHMALVVQALAGFSRLRAVWKPFEYSNESLRWYLAMFFGVLILLSVSSTFPLSAVGDGSMDIGSACLIYPVCHSIPGWPFVLAQYISLDIILHGICAILALLVVRTIRSSGSGQIQQTPLKREAMKRSALYGSSQIVSLLISLLVQVLAVALEFGDQEMALVFTLQSLLTPVFFTLSSTSFRDWLLRR